MSNEQKYPIGQPGKKWGDEDKLTWLNKQSIKRSYHQDVVTKIEQWAADFDVINYGALTHDIKKYPLYLVKTKNWQLNKKNILVTGGVHGYETSGVKGAIRFIESQALNYTKQFNLIIAPCISPWGYETINRWNAKAIDPNRSFYANSPAEESAALMRYFDQHNVEIFAHIDLHETTDTDNTTFRPALSARDAVEQKEWQIPDGFYLVGDTIKPEDDFQQAIITAVEKITHIAPADDEEKLIGVSLSQRGVINYDTKALGLCSGFTEAAFVTTTEVYPDSPKADNENCILAQVAAITGALDFLINIK
jgi:hypothetical protein